MKTMDFSLPGNLLLRDCTFFILFNYDIKIAKYRALTDTEEIGRAHLEHLTSIISGFSLFTKLRLRSLFQQTVLVYCLRK